jgi:hypothetical protein
MATIRMANYGTKLGSLQEYFLPFVNSDENYLAPQKLTSDG